MVLYILENIHINPRNDISYITTIQSPPQNIKTSDFNNNSLGYMSLAKGLVGVMGRKFPLEEFKASSSASGSMSASASASVSTALCLSVWSPCLFLFKLKPLPLSSDNIGNFRTLLALEPTRWGVILCLDSPSMFLLGAFSIKVCPRLLDKHILGVTICLVGVIDVIGSMMNQFAPTAIPWLRWKHCFERGKEGKDSFSKKTRA